MKRKRYRKGDLMGNFLVFHKEVLPLITNSGKRKVRQAFFRCLHHDVYYKLTFQAAKSDNRGSCLCKSQFNGESIHTPYSEEDVAAYSFMKAKHWHKKATKETPPGWFWVSRIGIFLKKEDGSNLLFYKFQKSDKSGADYRAARRIEDITWNRPKANKAFYLMRLSYEYDALHRDGLIIFKSDLWNRGAGMEAFNEILDQL